MKNFKSFILSFLFITALFSSCGTKVNPNEYVVSTATCWNTYTVTKAGQPIPRLLTNCDRMIILPATELSADFVCNTKFAKRVAGKLNFTYQWRIIDPIAFVQSAKSITSSSTETGYKISADALENIENTVVDKMLIDIIREYTPNQEAGVDELQIEKDLEKLSRVQFTDRGVMITNMSVNVDFSQQTEEALDVISALRFYELNNERELGIEVIKAKAGANVINVHK